MKTLIVRALKPRNPLVAASLRRHAGVHRRSAGGSRQRAERSLKHELRELHRQHRSP